MFRMPAEMFRVGTMFVTVMPPTWMAGVLMVLAPLPISIDPAMVAEVSGLLDETVIALAFVRVSRPPLVTVGAVVPPLLTNVRLSRVFAPTRVSVELPFKVTAFVLAI